MGYQEDFHYYESVGRVRNTVTPIHRWGEKPEEYIGKVINVDIIGADDENEGYPVYDVETDNGLIRFAFGEAYERRADVPLCIGDLIRIVYGGKIVLPNGRRMNDLVIQVAERGYIENGTETVDTSVNS